MRRRLHALPADTYWVYDGAESLIYVGISFNALSRLESHRATAPWWHLAETVKIKRFASRSAAAREEAFTIATSAPPYNERINGRALVSRRAEPECIDEMEFPIAWLRELRRA